MQDRDLFGDIVTDVNKRLLEKQRLPSSPSQYDAIAKLFDGLRDDVYHRNKSQPVEALEGIATKSDLALQQLKNEEPLSEVNKMLMIAHQQIIDSLDAQILKLSQPQEFAPPAPSVEHETRRPASVLIQTANSEPNRDHAKTSTQQQRAAALDNLFERVEGFCADNPDLEATKGVSSINIKDHRYQGLSYSFQPIPSGLSASTRGPIPKDPAAQQAIYANIAASIREMVADKPAKAVVNQGDATTRLIFALELISQGIYVEKWTQEDKPNPEEAAAMDSVKALYGNKLDTLLNQNTGLKEVYQATVDATTPPTETDDKALDMDDPTPEDQNTFKP